MASETARIAKSLVASREESFASPHSRDAAEARVAAALAPIHPKRVAFARRWRDDSAGLVLDATFHPTPGIRRFLQAASVVLMALIASSVWAVRSADDEGALAFLLPLVTVLAILAFPLVVVAMGSQREAEEARIARAIRRALTDEAESGAGRSR